MNIHVIHLARVNALARFRIGLVRKPQVNPVRHGQRPIEFWPRGRAGKHADLEFLPAEMGVCNAVRQLNRHRLRISRPGKPAHANLVAGPNQCRRLCGAHDLVFKLGVQNARGGRRRNTHRKGPHSL